MTWATRRGPWPLTRSWPPSSPKVVAASHRSGRSTGRAVLEKARLVNLTSRKTHALFTSVNLGMWPVACICDVLRQVFMRFTWCSAHVVAYVVVLCSSCPMACHKSGADRCGADRGRPCAADLGRCAACAAGARAVSRRGAGRRCASAVVHGRNRGACCW